MHNLSFYESNVSVMSVLWLWQSTLNSSAVRQRRREITGIIFKPVCKVASGFISSAPGSWSTREFLGGCTKNIYRPEFFCVSFKESDIWCTERFLSLEYLWDDHIHISVHFGSRVHELKSKDTSLLDTCRKREIHSSAMIQLPHVDGVHSCGSTISEFLCVKIRLPNTSAAAVSNLPQYDSLSCFRATIDPWSLPASLLTQCWIESSINFAPMNQRFTHVCS